MERKEVQIRINEKKELDIIKLYPKFKVEIVKMDPYQIRYENLKGLKIEQYYNSTTSRGISKLVYTFDNEGLQSDIEKNGRNYIIYRGIKEVYREKKKDIVIIYDDKNNIIFAYPGINIGDEYYIAFDKKDRIKLYNHSNSDRIECRIYEYTKAMCTLTKDKTELTIKRNDASDNIEIDNDLFTLLKADKEQKYTFNNLMYSKSTTESESLKRIYNTSYNDCGEARMHFISNDFILYKGKECLGVIRIKPQTELKITLDVLDRIIKIKDSNTDDEITLMYKIFV